MATLTNAQIVAKKQQLQQLTEQAKDIVDELMEQREQSDACIDSAEARQKKAEGQLTEAGAWPLSEDDLDDVAGGMGTHPSPRQPQEYGIQY